MRKLRSLGRIGLSKKKISGKKRIVYSNRKGYYVLTGRKKKRKYIIKM